MKKEDIEFLRELQHELNTQEHDEQAAPRFWGIMEDVEYPSNENDYDNAYIYDCADCEVRSYEQIVDWVDDIISDEHPELKDEWNEDVKDNYELEDLCEWIKDNLDWDVEVVYSRNYEKLSVETGCFLTKRAAKRHLKLNHYHYKNGKTYAMTAWRNPEFERLLNILQTMNMDDIKVTDDNIEHNSQERNGKSIDIAFLYEIGFCGIGDNEMDMTQEVVDSLEYLSSLDVIVPSDISERGRVGYEWLKAKVKNCLEDDIRTGEDCKYFIKNFIH